jgi:hypothetical protein
MGKQDRVARENIGSKIILCQPLLLGGQDSSIALFTYAAVFAAEEKPVYTGR